MSTLSVVSVADRAGFHIFAGALRSSCHLEALEGEGPFTLFAPSDEAFQKFAPDTLHKLLHHDADLLATVLGYHFAIGQVAMSRFADKRIRAVMCAGGDVRVDGRSGVRVNAARMVKPDLGARNGVVHGIDGVLWPKQPIERAA